MPHYSLIRALCAADHLDFIAHVMLWLRIYFRLIFSLNNPNFSETISGMSYATLLFPGTSLAYHVLDYAVDWAKENEGSLHVLFLHPGTVPPEGYPFPNDLDEAEDMTTEVEAQQGVKQILKQEARYIEKRANASHIPAKTEILFSPSIDQVIARVNHSEIIFIDKSLEENPETFEGLEFDLQELKHKTSRHLYEVGESDKYSDVFY